MRQDTCAGPLGRDSFFGAMIQDNKQILVVDDEANFRTVLAGHLACEGYEVHEADGVESAAAYLREHHIDMVLTDLRMGQNGGAGMEVLQASLDDDASRPVVMITGNATIASAVEATKLGAFDYLQKPIDAGQLRDLVAKALRAREIRSRAATGGVHLAVPSRCPAMMEVERIIERVADSPTRVLITGETGTGKELVARELRHHSRRRAKPFVAVNCAAIPKDLVESELFGHEKGAFTGAVEKRVGKFEIASGGTLFLDEVGEMPLEVQAKLLRVLQEQSIERIGQGKRAPIPVDVRLIAATNRDLERERQGGSFRDDLFYRLAVVEIALPPLRERREDVPALCEHFIAKLNGRLSRRVEGIEPDALDRLVRHAWPGNIRQLENVIERSMILADGPRIRVVNLPADLRRDASAEGRRASPGAPAEGGSDGPQSGLKERARADKYEAVEAALRQTGGNVTQAAKLLKVSRKALQNWLKEMKKGRS
jgi:two-component system response regulator AtoC